MTTPRDYTACSGCSLCRLVCPMWRARRDPRFSAEGLAKMRQNGAVEGELVEVLDACTLCGACDPVCPENIALTDMIVELRGEVELPSDLAVLQVGYQQAAVEAVAEPMPPGALLLPGSSLRGDRELLERVASLLGLPVAPDDGADIVLALEIGGDLDARRCRRFLDRLDGRSLVVGDGLLLRWLRRHLPGANLQTLGEGLGHLSVIRGAIRPDDFYAIEPRAFHADHERLVGHYDALRQATGCTMNLDLQRIAVSPWGGGYAGLRMGVGADDLAQTRWMLEGWRPVRILVENPSDRALVQRVAGVPVLHLAELAVA